MRISILKTFLTVFLVFKITFINAKDFALVSSHEFKNLKVRTALDKKSKQIGLMNVKKIKDYDGMLFLYSEPIKVSIWMQNTIIPLDVIFIDERKKISSIQNGIPYSTKLLSSSVNVVAVLEIPRGCSKKLKIKIGDQINWILKKKREIKNITYYYC